MRYTMREGRRKPKRKKDYMGKKGGGGGQGGGGGWCWGEGVGGGGGGGGDRGGGGVSVRSMRGVRSGGRSAACTSAYSCAAIVRWVERLGGRVEFVA